MTAAAPSLRIGRRSALFVLFAVLCAVASGAAANLDGRWQAQCAPGETPGQRACAVLAAKPFGDDPTNFVQILVSPAAGRAFMVLIRPSDGRAAGCMIHIDAREPVRSESILAGACLFHDASGALVERLQHGETLRLLVRSTDGSEDTVTFSLDGFGESIGATRRQAR